MKALRGLFFVHALISATVLGATKNRGIGSNAGCGDPLKQFWVRFSPGDHTIRATIDSSMAQVFVIEVYDPSNHSHFLQPVLRQGIDGKWIGATQGLSFVEANVSPGRHQLCSQWQSQSKRLASEVSLNSFTAEGGKRYYFRAQVQMYGTPLDLQPISEEEAKQLMLNAKPTFSMPKD